MRFVFLVAVGIVLPSSVETANAQFYGGGFYGGGFYGNGFYGGNMAAFAPPHSIGGYYPVPYGAMVPGPIGGYGYNPGYYGFAAPGYGPYGGMGYGGLGNGNPFAGYPGFGWWPLSATDVKTTAVPASSFQGRSLSAPGNSSSGIVSHQQPASVSFNPPVMHTGENIKLVCPKTAAGSLTYLLNGYPYTIQPGYSQTFPDDRAWKLEFYRGGEGSEVVGYTLKPGTYNFGVGSGGWELRQVVKAQSSDLPPAPSTSPTPTPSPST